MTRSSLRRASMQAAHSVARGCEEARRAAISAELPNSCRFGTQLRASARRSLLDQSSGLRRVSPFHEFPVDEFFKLLGGATDRIEAQLFEASPDFGRLQRVVRRLGKLVDDRLGGSGRSHKT